jgi:hypothetical protein
MYPVWGKGATVIMAARCYWNHKPFEIVTCFKRTHLRHAYLFRTEKGLTYKANRTQKQVRRLPKNLLPQNSTDHSVTCSVTHTHTHTHTHHMVN